jgi:outer membrane immunogenic protein
MKVILSLVAAAACLTAAPAMAQVYGSVGYSGIKSSDIDANFGAITGRIGAHINPYIGGELEGSFGVKEDTVNVEGYDVKLKLDHEIGAYVVGFWPVNDSFEVLGRVGVANIKGSGSVAGVTVSDSGSGVAYGVGAQYFFTQHNGVRADYTRDEAAGDNVWTLSYAFRF